MADPIDKAVDEITKRAPSGLLERLRNPIVGSFLVTWSIFNWKIWIILISPSASALEKISHIQQVLDTEKSFLYPLIIAFLYFFMSPWVWLLIRLYLDRADSYVISLDRKKKQDEQEFEQEYLQRELQNFSKLKDRNQILEEVNLMQERLAAVTAQSRDQRVALSDLERSAREIVASIQATRDDAIRDIEGKTEILRKEVSSDCESGKQLLAAIVKARDDASNDLAEKVDAARVDAINEVSRNAAFAKKEIDQYIDRSSELLDERIAAAIRKAEARYSSHPAQYIPRFESLGPYTISGPGSLGKEARTTKSGSQKGAGSIMNSRNA